MRRGQVRPRGKSIKVILNVNIGGRCTVVGRRDDGGWYSGSGTCDGGMGIDWHSSSSSRRRNSSSSATMIVEIGRNRHCLVDWEWMNCRTSSSYSSGTKYHLLLLLVWHVIPSTTTRRRWWRMMLMRVVRMMMRRYWQVDGRVCQVCRLGSLRFAGLHFAILPQNVDHSGPSWDCGEEGGGDIRVCKSDKPKSTRPLRITID
mmetsp:Transcript_11377/g.18507  ORF Transcript_11377/g.18507 Transcript_11377/m.18507 type:complete len:202 (+) Transcript_11377:156-761(+)